MRYVRAAALCAVLGFSFIAAGCSGSGGGATPPVPLPDQATQGVSGSTLGTMSTTVSPPSSGSYNLHVQGKIVAIKSATEFQIQGGAGVGYLNVYTNGSTVDHYNGLALKVGNYADIYGNGSVSTYLTATQITLSTSSDFTSGTATSSTTSSSAYDLHVTGQIVAVKSSTEFQINGGSGVGYLNVYTSGSTSISGGLPKVGYYADVYGNGSVATYVKAIQVTISSSSSFTSSPPTGTTPAPSAGSYNLHVQGNIVAVKSSTEFQINGGSGVGYLNVYTTSSTVTSGSAKVGENANVYGNGSVATYVTATQVTFGSTSSGSTPTSTPPPSTTPTAGVPSHVMTAAVVWGYGGVPTSVSISSVKPYVTWVQTDPSYASQMRANGLKVDVYENFWRNYSSDNPSVGYTDLRPGGAHAAAEARNCSGTAIHDPTYGGGYEADARSSYAAGHAAVFTNYRLQEYGSNYDAVFSDDTGAMGGISLPCGWSQSTYQSAVNSVDASLKVPMFINALGAASNPVNQVGYTNASNVIGAMCEICLSANNGSSDYVQTGTYWQGIENAAIQMVEKHKIFWDYARAIGYPQSELGLRTYVYASFLLTYDPSYSMLQEALKSSHGFSVMPETGLVPEDPVTTASTVTGYQRSGGAYMREFGACYYRGVNKGRCAVVVNPTGSTITVPTTAYSHSIVLSGAGVLDGGTVSFSGSRPSSLAPSQAAILFP